MMETAPIQTPPVPPEVAPPAGEISRLTEHLFRHEAGKLVSVLTGIFGTERLQLAEDLVQEALARALQTWPYHGIPKNPAAWLTQTAKNLGLDLIRREKLFREKESQIIATLEQWPSSFVIGNAPVFENEIRDDRLRMMFVCCHPHIPADAQAALALKTLCGFSVTEISRAFLTSEAAVAKRLTRARQKIRDEQIPFEIPVGEALAPRLDGVLQSLYLLFNEGYKASGGEKLVRAEICEEAIRLTQLLAENPAGDSPKTHALLALMLLTGARLPARVDDAGNLLRLQEQDRTRWDQAMMARGLYHFARSAAGAELSEYHLQAGIAACHCAAPDYAATDWRKILALYDQLAEFDESPVVALNRAIVVANLNGPRAGLKAVASIPGREKLDGYYLYYAVMGDFEEQLGDPLAAAGYFRKAVQLANTSSEQEFLSRRFRACEERIGS